jgi:hypothetical protein
MHIENVFKKIINHVNNGEEVSFSISLDGRGAVDEEKCPLNENDKSILFSWLYDEVMTQSFITDNLWKYGFFKFVTWKRDGKQGLDLIFDMLYEENYDMLYKDSSDEDYVGEEYEEVEEMCDVFSFHYE